MFSFRNLYVRLPLYILYFGREKKREKETVGVLCYVCTEYVHTNTLYSVSSGFCLVYLQKTETESMAITSMAGGPFLPKKHFLGKEIKYIPCGPSCFLGRKEIKYIPCGPSMI